jgi:HK97 family phage major capsid protein
MTEITETIEKIGRAFEDFKKSNDQRLAEIEKRGYADPIATEKVEKLASAITDLNGVKERVDRLETLSARPDFGGSKANFAAEEHAEKFFTWIRERSAESASALRSFERDLRQKGVFTTGTGGDAAGGYAVPEELSRQIERNLIELSPVRSIARVVTASSPDYKQLVDVRGATTGWVGEKGSRAETDTPSLAEVAPTFGTLYARPTATEESLNDIFFDVGSWLVESVGEEMAKAEGIAFISGNGANKPTGFLNGSPSAAGDYDSPARAFGTLQYIPTGNATGFGAISTSSPEFYPADVFITTAYALKAGYRNNARWMMNKNTLAEVMKFKDSEGNYIWRPGLAPGQPSTIIGYPVVEAQDMPDLGLNAYPVAFGDFRSGYLVVDLVGMRMTVDDNITAPGYVKWYLRRRLGGKILKDEAIKLIKCATS